MVIGLIDKQYISPTASYQIIKYYLWLLVQVHISIQLINRIKRDIEKAKEASTGACDSSFAFLLSRVRLES